MEIPRTIRNVDPCSLGIDSNGYSIYGFVLYAESWQIDAVQRVRETVRVRRAMMPAHVTVKGPVCEIPSIEFLQRVVEEVARSIPPVEVKFGESKEVRTLPNGEVVATQSIVVTDELLDLHVRLIEALNQETTTAYRGEADGVYGPHLTIYHEPEPDLETKGASLLENLDLGTGFISDRITLTGNAGRLPRGEWSVLSEHYFGGV